MEETPTFFPKRVSGSSASCFDSGVGGMGVDVLLPPMLIFNPDLFLAIGWEAGLKDGAGVALGGILGSTSSAGVAVGWENGGDTYAYTMYLLITSL
jgi:hypothetical protein